MHARFLVPFLLAAALGCTAQPVRREMSPDDLVTRLASAPAAEREAIAREAWKAGPEGLLALAGPLASDDPALVKNALLAAETIAHRTCAPGSPADRERAGGALVALLGAPLDAHVRCEVARLLGAVAADRASVTALADQLADAETAEAALFALERCNHPDAGAKLIEALGRRDLAVSKVAVINALGARREGAAGGELVAVAERGSEDEARAARGALSRSADPRAETLLTDAAAARSPGAVADLLRYAEGRLAAGDKEDVRRVVTNLMDSPEAHERAAALLLAAQAGGEPEIPKVIAALADPAVEVRSIARAELVASRSTRTPVELERALDAATQTGAPSRGEILRVIVLRGDRSAQERLMRAATDSSPQIRVVALELAGQRVDTMLEDHVLKATRSVDSQERAVARQSLVAYADAKRMAQDQERALALYHALLDGGDDDRATRAALAGVAALAQPASLEHVRPLAGRPELAEEVDRARVDLARGLAASDRDAAVAELESVCTGSASRSVRSEAATALAGLGVEVGALAPRRGFLTTWYVCGPIPRAAGDELGAHPFGNGGPALPSGDSGEAGPGLPQWKRIASQDLDGALDLDSLLDPHDNVCAYALCEIPVDEAREAVLKLGSDDGVAVWLNGERVHVNDVARGLTVDEDEVPLKLQAGSNKLLVQIGQGGGDWGLCARLCGPDGAPVDLSH
jgi:hypothetical protein